MSITGDTTSDFNPIKANAYSPDPKFDLIPAIRSDSPVTGATDVFPAEEIYFNPEVSLKYQPSKDWEVDVRPLVSTKKWLQTYGLKKNRLSLDHLLPQIGFKHSDDFDPKIKRPICSRYGENLFQRFLKPDGQTFNVAAGRDKMKQVESRLTQAIALYKRRLEWLTTESRRIFGVVEEKSACIVMDIKNLSPQQFDQYRAALERVLTEQVVQLSKFNIIRASENLVSYSDVCVPVTSESLEGAVKWMWQLNRCDPVAKTSTCEAVVKALSDNSIEAVYIVSEGCASDGSRELLREKLSNCRIPIHVVSYNCTKSETISFLKEIVRMTGGRFHAYAVVMEMDAFESGEVDPNTSQANIIMKKRTYGGVPPGAGIRDDVISLFEELEEARNILGQIQACMIDIPQANNSAQAYQSLAGTMQTLNLKQDETYMSSREWLSRHGLRARKLGFYDVLSGVAFKHQDGVVDIKCAPVEEYQTDAVNNKKLVHAKYCDRFPHVRWKNGQVVHVQVTPEFHRNYEQRMRLALEAMQQRVDWLQQGSRELFGTVIEDQIYILIDTSASMSPHIQFVKDKLFSLMQEQLRHKQKFNLVSFDSGCGAWKDELMAVSEKTLHSAWNWIKGLTCRGSTNTLGALRLALADSQSQAIYLLTDGRPDQPPKSILSQVQLHPQVPIHTISFNCSDREANEFLCQLAKETAGRFHYYSENGIDKEGPEPWESEDIRLLRSELEVGYQNLEKIGKLRDECAALAWRKNEFVSPKHSNKLSQSQGGMPPLAPKDLYRPDCEARPQSAPPPHRRSTSRPQTAHSNRSQLVASFSPGRPKSARPPNRPLTAASMSSIGSVAGHTKTSLLRTLNSNGGFNMQDWLLPETSDLFNRQWERQKLIMEVEEKKKRKTKKKNGSKFMSSKKWLSKHGLAAQKLTILDALSPTFIPHSPKYVPILNKHVLSKVFDDVLPIAHASSGRTKVRIVNPQGANLNNYTKQVEKALDKYRKRLDVIVWNGLSEAEKQEFDSEGPVAFCDNREKLMDALERSGSPVRTLDIKRLEKEIQQGEMYIQQASDLLQASRNTGSDSDDDQSSMNSDASDRSQMEETKNRNTESEAEVDEQLHPTNSTTEQRDSGDDRPAEVDIQKPAYKQRVVIKEPAGWKKKRPSSPNKVTRGRIMMGQKVIGRNAEDGFYYPGVVTRYHDSQRALVHFQDLGPQTVPARCVIPVSGAIATPSLQNGDYVLCRVMNHDTGLVCYVPGEVQLIPQKASSQTRFYTVLLYVGQREHVLRSYLYKISNLRYSSIINYIDTISQNNEEDEGDEEEQDEHRSPGHRIRRSRESPTYGSDSSPSRSRSRSYSDSRSRSRSGSRSPQLESRDRINSGASTASNSEADSKHTDSRRERQRQRRLERWQRHLEQQQQQQLRDQKKIKKQMHKLARLQSKLAQEQTQGDKNSGETRRLLEAILAQVATPRDKKSGHTPRKETVGSSEASSKLNRTHAWVSHQNGTPDNAQDQLQVNVDTNKMLVSAGDKGLLISAGEDLPEAVMAMREAGHPLKPGEEVLARWSDEGWYYRGTVCQDCGDHSYFIEDNVGDVERLWREDILTDQDSTNVTVQPRDAVIALHPQYSYSYAPGVVLEADTTSRIMVRLYDGAEGHLPREEVFPIPAEKFELDIAYIVQCEERWVGQAVVARNDETGLFQLGAVRERIGNGRQYVVEWSDGQLSIQNSSCVFGAFTKRHPVTRGDRVLAIADEEHLIYLPGIVSRCKSNTINIKFCNETKAKGLDPIQCFWLSEQYYDEAVTFLRNKQKGSSSRHD